MAVNTSQHNIMNGRQMLADRSKIFEFADKQSDYFVKVAEQNRTKEWYYIILLYYYYYMNITEGRNGLCG